MSYVRYYNLDKFADKIDLPFRVKFNFKKLVAWWEAQALLTDSPEYYRAQEVLKQIEKTPGLRGSFDDPEWIEQYHEVIQMLLSPFFPSLTTTNETKAASMPYQPFLFNLTKRFASVMEAAEGDIYLSMKNPDIMYVFGCVTILNSIYGANIQYSPTLFFDIPDKKTGILRRYRAFFNADFSEIVPIKEVQPLTEEEIRQLTNNFNDIPLWKKKIPPGSFCLEGFSIITIFDVTKEEAISALKYDLLRKDALITMDSVERIQANICALLSVPDIHVGFICYQRERKLLQPMGYGFRNSIILSDEKAKSIEEVFCDESKYCIFRMKHTLILPEIEERKDENDVLIAKLAELGLKSYMAIPLLYNEELTGYLELGSDKSNILNSIAVHKLQDVVPLFTTALKRLQDEKENQVEAIIRQKCTAIHPAVAWSFTQAAENLLENQSVNDNTLEDIVFGDVYPLYGQADIQGSSTERNRSIQADLIEQLTLAKNVLDVAIIKYGLPLYQELQFRIDHYIQQLKEGLSAGDENIILEFLTTDIYPVFHYLHEQDSGLKQALQYYHKQLDANLGTVYKQRKYYEQSVKLINNNISEYLDQAQLAAQKMFPHYFEKYKTDGVEHNLYIGQSMVNDKTFHPLYLKNLRLWQLLVTCEMENSVQRLQPQLKTSLHICSLILVHSNPLSIRFRMEEKKFDVDGTYNIRYEIIKKRIDKAIIKETGERLTQPGKIAIIYSQDKEAHEYMNYLRYLQSIDYIGADIEWLTLKDLQGITGLKALRVNVVYHQNFDGINESKAAQALHAIS
jgi:hypothetical protein